MGDRTKSTALRIAERALARQGDAYTVEEVVSDAAWIINNLNSAIKKEGK